MKQQQARDIKKSLEPTSTQRHIEKKVQALLVANPIKRLFIEHDSSSTDARIIFILCLTLILEPSQ